MRVESSVTSLSWISPEAVWGTTRLPSDVCVTHDDDPPPHVSRRRLLRLAVLAGVVTACRGGGDATTTGATPGSTSGAPPDGSGSATTAGTRAGSPGRLRSRPGVDDGAWAPGTHALGVARERDALLRIPAGHDPARPGPFVLTLHGAGGDAPAGMAILAGLADELGLVLLAPASREATWGHVRGKPGADVAVVDEALAVAFSHIGAAPAAIAVAGFSDGASTALGLGIDNGDLFGHVVAFSPGIVASTEPVGRPRVYVSHGTGDEVLPIDRSSRRLVPQLERDGYAVRYREFEGGHAVPAEIARDALTWLQA